MVQYIITPWRSKGELLHVRQQLYPDSGKPLNVEDRKQAVAQVSVWMQRGNCPHLVESTAILTSAILNDVPGNSTYCVRAAYSAAFCRFVTGLLDSHQDKRRKLSMYYIAKTIGLPATYVELRHQATHEELPSLSKLRTATQKALRWIWDYYWAQLSSAASETTDCKALILSILQEENEASQRQMESGLQNWDQDKLLGALAEIQDSTEDAAVLLRATRLYQKILNLAFRSSESDFELDYEPAAIDLERVKKELSQMEDQLSDSDNALPGSSPTGINQSTSPVKGWALWEGPWVPKPIGVV